MLKQHILAIDPSIKNLGWATFCGGKDDIEYLDSEAWDYGVFHPTPPIFDSIRVGLIHDLICNRGYHINTLVVEMPTFHDSEKGRIAARQDFTIKLGAIAGYTMGRLGLDQAHMHLYRPIDWKGNVPKEATQKKFIRDFKNGYYFKNLLTHDTIDAIMLLRFYLEKELT